MSSCKNRRITGEISGDKLPDNSSSSVIGSNNDLLRQILWCLPVKSLLVFKSVSKTWLSLISDPYFIHNHCLRNHPSIPGLFLQKTSYVIKPEFEFMFLDGNINGGVPFKALNFMNNPAGIKIQQSCNGLLCCSSFKSSRSNRSYYIYNPSTKHYTILPQSQFRENGRVRSVSLAFDPLKSPHYEAICIWRYDTDNYQIEIYSSKTASWRLSGDPFPAPNDDSFFKSGVFWNGSLHWISLRDSDSIGLSEYSLYYFDIGRELLKRMPVPPIPNYEWEMRSIGYFGECRGHLHLIEIYDSWTTRFDILEMDADYTGWNIKYHVDLEGLTINVADSETVHDDSDVEEEFLYRFEFSVLYVEEKEEEESSTLVLHIPEKVISYDLKEMRCKKIHDLSSSLRVEGSLQAYQYIESLACV
ncbi:F-box domain [Macleaya cordata]|uniref:F-box domain n=1 Tax=Macleaya cordata TaxID=56857 RepID=A0A200R993_MACCD|nr:F-box domain [Macleaya cordata]